MHSTRSERPGQGENLWMGTHERYSVEAMFAGWAAEKRIFRPGFIPNVSTTGRFADVGHYTQIIWAQTQRLGCAVRETKRWDYLVCRYAPAGNVVGRRVP